jgi:hypothetical protein
MHGHNSVIAFSRPIYFCLAATAIILLDSLAKKTKEDLFISDAQVGGDGVERCL